MANIFITGVSSGLGRALAEEYLRRGDAVFGLSRREPQDLPSPENFRFLSHDVTEHVATGAVVEELLRGVETVDVAILNAGTLGPFEDLSRVSLDDLRQVMEVNVWANKTLIDALFAGRGVAQLVAISSGASVNGNRGWAGYAVSKAALNMLVKLCAREHEQSHFCALAPGLVETDMLNSLLERGADDRFPSLEKIRSKRGTPEMKSPQQAAARVVAAIAEVPHLVESGAYADVRKPPLTP